eukprot:gene21114-biopygen1767
MSRGGCSRPQFHFDSGRELPPRDIVKSMIAFWQAIEILPRLHTLHPPRPQYRRPQDGRILMDKTCQQYRLPPDPGWQAWLWRIARRFQRWSFGPCFQPMIVGWNRTDRHKWIQTTESQSYISTYYFVYCTSLYAS